MRLTAEQFRAQAKSKRPKYGNRKTADADSEIEGGRKRQLKLMEQAGQISDLQFQVQFPLHVNGSLACTYIADAVYTENLRFVAEDAKGFRDPVYAIKAKLFQLIYPEYRFAEYRKGEGRVFLRQHHLDGGVNEPVTEQNNRWGLLAARVALRACRRRDRLGGAGMKTYLFSYHYQGKEYGFEIRADSEAEARGRAAAIASGHAYDGEAVVKIPVNRDFLSEFRWGCGSTLLGVFIGLAIGGALG